MKVFQSWREAYADKYAGIEANLFKIEAILDHRIKAIVEGKHRSRYVDIAVLASALGEVKESRGEIAAKKRIADKYRAMYQRHSSLKGAFDRWT